LDALCDEIKRLHGMREESGCLSRSNERKLKVCKLRLQGLLGAVVLFSEDRLHIPAKEHMQLAFYMGELNNRLKEHFGEINDGKLLALLFDIFEFEVSRGTFLRYYYMSEDEKENGK
jgi:hypothetical protein